MTDSFATILGADSFATILGADSVAIILGADIADLIHDYLDDPFEADIKAFMDAMHTLYEKCCAHRVCLRCHTAVGECMCNVHSVNVCLCKECVRYQFVERLRKFISVCMCVCVCGPHTPARDCNCCKCEVQVACRGCGEIECACKFKM